MDTRELKQLAIKATLLMAEVAAKAAQELAAKTVDREKSRLTILSEIMGCLIQVYGALQDPVSGEEEKIASRLPRLLIQLETVCTWPKKSPIRGPQFPFLHRLTARESHSVNAELCRAIMAFVMNGGQRVGSFISNLDKFASAKSPGSNTRQPGIMSTKMSNELIESPDEYPSTVNTLLYTALSRHFNCTCPGDSPREHWARLRLATQIKQVEDHVLFDILFSATPASQCLQQIRWQQLRLQVPSKTRRSIRFAQDVGKDEPRPSLHAEKHTIIELGRFCALLGRPLGSVCVPLKIVDGHLCELDNPALPDQHVAKASSVSLSNVLERHQLPAKAKIVLAYTLAKAVWRYYNSDFMKTPWTTESVHFMREDRRNMSQDEINPASPCFAFRPLVSAEFESTEYCANRHVYHRYPRVLALGVLLVAIVENQVPLGHTGGSSTEERMNDDLMTCRDIAKGRNWPNLGLQNEEASLIYRDAVDKCLDPDLFHVSSSNGEEDQAGIRQRRNALYTHIVLPLESLCEDCGIIDKQDIGRLVYSHSIQPKIQPTPGFLATLSQQINHSQAWMQSLAGTFLSENVVKQYRLNRSLTRIRIAILDTGYDSRTQFFQPPSRKKRVIKWKDFVGGQEEHVDCDGHGTHVLSLAMKIAPAAEICVARVANSTKDLAQSGCRVADAIKWATDPRQGNADIVSMSFGFPEEPYVDGTPVISNAIHKAMHDRDGRILFFAATANDGANQTEMFPARHPNVISIRATDHKGSFQDFNPAADYSGPHVFGTLGTDIPGAGLNTHDGEVCETGVSMATPIAAGIAAMILMYVRLGLESQQLGTEIPMEKLWTKSGMDSVLRKLSRRVREKHYYIYPHDFFRGDKDTERNALLIDALRLS
ncbi:hypothetical protein CEP53_002994 [Fusarium sp. AF-6]|nr:hypothetical protein CEP53_002994 [Fusarium sp. AF-6]